MVGKGRKMSRYRLYFFDRADRIDGVLSVDCSNDNVASQCAAEAAQGREYPSCLLQITEQGRRTIEPDLSTGSLRRPRRLQAPSDPY